jgi:L-ascorbate metabolism protein UlaG (beta-lactamase superfamily)
MSARITWLGHATVLIELGGLSVLTDPLLRSRVAHLRRHVPVPALPAGLDAVLLSHLHRDHADRPTLRRLAGVPALVPRGAGNTVRALGVRTVTELRAGDRAPAGDGEVLAVPAVHDGRRSPLHRAADALGFVVEQGGMRIYFAGDTEIFAGMADLGPLDAALVPVWGWGPSLGPGHLDPEGAAQAVAMIAPRVAVPIHWGTYSPYVPGRPPSADPPARFAARVAELAPEVRVETLSPGGSLEL